jgi:hypothetical protein
MSIIRSGLCICASLGTLAAGDASVPGSPNAPSPTPCGIAIEWPFSGDDDGDGRVTVRYRPATGTWRQGMPLFRVPAGSSAGFAWGNRHLGSLFDLQPATTYEIELSLADPDGGAVVRTLSVATRALPVAMAGAAVTTATPATFAAVAAVARPGDVVELAAGTYPGFTWVVDGEAARPIVLRSTAGAVIDGNIELIARRHVHLDGLTVDGRIRLNGSRGIAVQRCTIRARTDRGAGDGIVAFTRSEDAFIADNTVVGTTVWAEASLGVSGSNLGEGICLTGPGHVVRNNRVRGFRDGISLMEDVQDSDQYSIDIVDNDISECADDGIEADFAAHNVRVLRNRLTNCFIGLSSQPGLGGPTYFVRNVLYNIVHVPFKLYRTSHGDVLLHNTVVKGGDAFVASPGVPIVRLWARNNLFIGGPGGIWNGYSSGTGRVMSLYDLDVASASLDHDGYGSADGSFSGRFGASAGFTGLAQLRSRTSEVHGVEVGMSVFAASIVHPAAAMTTFAAPDLRLAASSPAVDAGVAIPGISDGFAGPAPDLGAHEVGAVLPVYGPRSPGTPDSTPPLITGPVIGSLGASGAHVSWTTDEAADSQVEFGTSAAYGSTTALDAGPTTVHGQALVGLAASTTYHLRARSRDASGNLAMSADVVFTTAPAGASGGTGAEEDRGGGGCGLGTAVASVLLGSALMGLRRRSR